jgi:hypothetical protein
MRRDRLLMCFLLAAALAGCGKKDDQVAANAPAKPPPEAPPTSAPPPPGPPLPQASAEACNLIATYVRAELGSEFGLPLMLYVPREPKLSISPSELSRDFADEVNPTQAKALAAAFTATLQEGAALTCDWRAVGLAQPAVLQPGKKDFIRFRTAIEPDIAVLDIFSTAGGLTQVGTRCLYKRAGAGWQRTTCVLTALS